jgi:hypothetical protein
MPCPPCPTVGADAGPASSGELNPISHTSRITAGFRAIEQRHPDPIITDPLAIHLAGPEGFATAQADWQTLNQLQGPAKHLRVPARNRILDDELLEAVAKLAEHPRPEVIQVVNLGCGMVSNCPTHLRFRHSYPVYYVPYHSFKQLPGHASTHHVAYVYSRVPANLY